MTIQPTIVNKYPGFTDLYIVWKCDDGQESRTSWRKLSRPHYTGPLIAFNFLVHPAFIQRSMEIHPPLKLILLLCISILLLSSSHAQARRVKYCDKDQNYAVKVSGVDILPDPVVRGKPATFKISASTGEAISSGKIIIEVSYFGVHVHTETHGFCDEVSCPVAAGDFVLAHTQTLPSFTPPGSYTLKMTMEDENNEQLSCISFNFKIGFRSSVSDV